jgi:aminoacrylate hydrolase
MVDDLIALLDALGIDRVNILGHSMGGMLGWALACKAPNRVKHLICASAVATVIPARIALFETLSGLRNDSNEAQWFELLYQFLFSPSFFANSAAVKQAVKNSLAYPYKQDQHSFATQVSGLASFIEPLNLDAIQCPVSLITGANDLLMTKALLQSFCQEHEYRFTILPDAAHALHWEQTDAFARYVLNELKPPQA